MSIVSDPFWFDDLSILINSKRIMEFFPSKRLSQNENLNALTRLGLYISLFMIFYTKVMKWINIFIFVLLLTYYLYSITVSSKSVQQTTQKVQLKTTPIIEKFDENDSHPEVIGIPEEIYTEGTTPETKPTNCTSPTLDNPFMNMTMKDYLNYDETGNIVQRLNACDTSDPEIKKQIDDNFKNNLYKDVNDLFGKFNSQRQYYTMPWTSLIPDIDGDFKNWLYKSQKTCKENQDYCLLYEDIRAKRPVV